MVFEPDKPGQCYFARVYVAHYMRRVLPKCS